MCREIWYTARVSFDYKSDGENWDSFKEDNGFDHFTELISLDSLLNELIAELEEKMEHQIIDQHKVTLFYDSLEYLMKITTGLERFNLLAVVREPKEIKADISELFDFVGYDLIDDDSDISVLVNCGGFDNIFTNNQLNRYGLITDYRLARSIQKALVDTYFCHHHTDSTLYEVWKHKTAGVNN